MSGKAGALHQAPPATATSALPADTEPYRPDYRGTGRPPAARYRRPFSNLAELTKAADPEAWTEIEWRDGTRGPMRSRFIALRVRPANVKLRRADPDGQPPVRWLLAEWAHGNNAPSDFWLSNLPPDTPTGRLVALAKLRWRIEHDYRELKDALGLDHFEGRSWPGWHHHVTLVSVAHGFLTCERLRRPPTRAAASRSSGSCKRSGPAGRAPAPRAADGCRPTPPTSSGPMT